MFRMRGPEVIGRLGGLVASELSGDRIRVYGASTVTRVSGRAIFTPLAHPATPYVDIVPSLIRGFSPVSETLSTDYAMYFEHHIRSCREAPAERPNGRFRCVTRAS